MLNLLFATLTLSILVSAPIAYAQAILAARVNGTGIPQERLERAFEEDLRQRRINLLQIKNPDRLKEMKRAVLDNLIEQELFWQAAQKVGTIATADEVAAAYAATKAQFKTAEAFEQRIRIEGFTTETYRELVRRQVSASKYASRVSANAVAVTDEEVHRFYVDNPDKFQRPEQVRARQILVKVAQGASAAERAAKRSHIEEILNQVRSGEDFDQLARLHSEAPTKQWGGEMDPFGRGRVAKALEDAAFALAPGQVSGVLTTPETFQIIKLESRDDAITVSEEQALERVRRYLQEVRERQVIAMEAERLRAAGDVKILLPL